MQRLEPVPASQSHPRIDVQPRPDPILIRALKSAHRLLAESGGAPIAAPDKAMMQAAPVGPYERGMLRLAFLAPDLQTHRFELT